MARNHSTTPERRSSKRKVCYTRTLKVREGLYTRTIKDKNHSAFDKTLQAKVPWINMQGRWLEQAGFEIDTPLKVRVMDGCLVLTAEQKPSQAFLAFEKLDQQRQALVLRTIDALTSKNRKS